MDKSKKPETCKDFFTVILTEDQVTNLFEAIFQDGGFSTSSELCDYISEDVPVEGPVFERVLARNFSSWETIQLARKKKSTKF